MKRRGFLGFMGGAAIAGPSVAKKVVAELPVGMPYVHSLGQGVGAYGQKDASSSLSNRDWRLNEIAQIKRLLSGELTDDEKEERQRQRLWRREQVINQNVACLQSVSGSRKMSIYGERMARHQEDIDRSHRQQRLYWLLRQHD